MVTPICDGVPVSRYQHSEVFVTVRRAACEAAR
jgi:hypothetical protein